MSSCSWHELPHREIWVVDAEYYPGVGLANGGRSGDAVTPLCVVAIEMRSGRVVRQWQDQFTPAPPYPLDAGAIMISFMATAEFGVHIALGWEQPACALDAYVEFRHFVNDGACKAGDREKGFYSLAGALRYFCEGELDVVHKADMRDRILQGPPFTAAEREAILDYCELDTRSLAKLVRHIVPTIRSLPHAMFRAKFQWTMAQQERRGVPVNLPQLEQFRAAWNDIQVDLAVEKDKPYGIYQIGDDGRPHWSSQRFADYLARNHMAWPRLASGSFDESDEAFRDMTGRYPHIATLRELRRSLSKFRLNSLTVGSDARNRTLLGGYGTKTARNAPSNAQYIWGSAKWVRFLIAPPPGLVLIHRDFCQQEVRIAAVLSGDAALLKACETGDVYLGIAAQLGFARDGMSPAELAPIRVLFKTVVLGIQYGLGAASLSVRTGISLIDAIEILARLRARFHAFESFAARAVDYAGLNLEIGTSFGWYMRCPSGMNARTIRNFPIQSAAAEVLHVTCILAERRGIRLVAPVHDALMAEAPVDQRAKIAAALDRVMRDASAVVLRGYELPTDCKTVLPGSHYDDKGGIEMWGTVTRLVAKLEARRA